MRGIVHGLHRNVVGAVLCVACGCADAPPELVGDWNVLFLNVELLRADHVGLIEPDGGCTPNIDRFFARSIVFEDVTAPAGETARSSASVLSAVEGLFFANEWRIRRAVREQKEQFAGTLTTIAEVLADRGFDTVCVNESNRSGRHIGYDTGFARYHELSEKERIDDSVAFVMRELEGVQSERFFLLYHPYTLHAPGYVYPVDRERLEQPAVRYVEEAERLTVEADFDAVGGAERGELAKALYAQQLRYVDDGLDALFRVLEESFVKDTIVVLYSNHGEGLFDNGVEAHGVSYQSCVRVPLLIRHPSVSAPIRITEPVSLVDLVPTVLEMVAVDAEPAKLAVSLLPLLEGGGYERTYIFGKNIQSRFVRRGDWKLIVGPEELYNLRDDPLESRNVIGEHPEVARELRAALLAREKEVAELRAGR